jgi:tetratricopeptide (TPR) repeat protein
MALLNPFPGLRPFEPEEDHLFFGREAETDELLRRLRTTRFLQVVGASGSGKSSLVRSGLIPALHSGFMAQASSSWRVCILRPGSDPIGNLAASLNSPGVLSIEGELASTNRVLLEATLRRSTLGLVNAARQARLPADENLLVVVDQFEELFRFRTSKLVENSRDEAVAFFKLLLEAAAQSDVPIYIVLTMRADFIGECMEFPGLPEAVNAGMYLVPRMARDELRSAITGPVAVAGSAIEQRLVMRLLNDLGDEQDRLPVLQHALMRTWDHWAAHHPQGQNIDIADYEAVGCLHQALSIHAEEAYQQTLAERHKGLAEKIFKALTDTYTDPRGVRRPTSIGELAAICEASEHEIVEVVEAFRATGRSFLTPPPSVPLESRTVVDLSHESLMRCWTRLIAWAEEEKESARSYVRISEASSWCADCVGGLWADPQLEIGLQWRIKNRPNAAWAERFDSNFAEAMDFLDRSEKQRELERHKELRRKQAKQAAIYVLVSLLLVVGGLLYAVRVSLKNARSNLEKAKEAVDQSLSSAGSQTAREAMDTPQTEEFRKDLLEKAKKFYAQFVQQNGSNEELRKEAAYGHIRLGDINRLLEDYTDSEKEYRESIVQLRELSAGRPGNLEYQQRLGYALMWLGETLRLHLEPAASASKPALIAAKKEYDTALEVQQKLRERVPDSRDYQQELARTYYTRGILLYDASQLDEAERDFRQAIATLEPLTNSTPGLVSGTGSEPEPAQDLARACNDLAGLLKRKWQQQGSKNLTQVQEPQKLFERAVAIHERLAKGQPENREYKRELAVFSDNLARLLMDEHQFELAEKYSNQAWDILEDLATPGNSLDMDRVRADITRARILEVTDPQSASLARKRALEILNRRRSSGDHPEYHAFYGNIADDFLVYAERSLQAGSLEDARLALDQVQQVMPQLVEPSRTRDAEAERRLRKELQDKKSGKH